MYQIIFLIRSITYQFLHLIISIRFNFFHIITEIIKIIQYYESIQMDKLIFYSNTAIYQEILLSK